MDGIHPSCLAVPYSARRGRNCWIYTLAQSLRFCLMRPIRREDLALTKLVVLASPKGSIVILFLYWVFPDNKCVNPSLTTVSLLSSPALMVGRVPTFIQHTGKEHAQVAAFKKESLSHVPSREKCTQLAQMNLCQILAVHVLFPNTHRLPQCANAQSP